MPASLEPCSATRAATAIGSPHITTERENKEQLRGRKRVEGRKGNRTRKVKAKDRK